MAPTNTTFFQEIRQLPRPIWVMTVGTFVDRFGAFIYPFLLLFLTNSGVSAFHAGLAVTLTGVGSFSGAIAGGFLADFIGRRNTIAVSMVAGATCGILLYTFVVRIEDGGSIFWVHLFCFFYGAVRGMYHPASSSLIADLVPKANRVAAFSVLRFGINFGWALGMAAGGWLADNSFGLLFVIDATTSLIFGAVALFGLPQGVRVSRSEASWGPAIRRIAKDRLFLALCLNTLMLATVFCQWSAGFALHVDAAGHSHPKEIFGWVMALNGFMIAIFELPISSLVRRLPRIRTVAFGTLVSAVGFSLFPLIPGVPGYLVAMFVFTIGEMVALPVQAAFVADLAPDQMRGRYNGVMGFTWSLAHIFAAPLGLILLGVSVSALCFTMLGLGLAATALLLTVREITEN